MLMKRDASSGAGQIAPRATPHRATSALSVPTTPASDSEAPALAVEGLGVTLGGRPVLNDVSLTVRRGELVGLIGPNGAGKTTVLRSVLSLVPRTGGTVTVRSAQHDDAAPRVGYVPQRHDFVWDYPISIMDAVVAARTPYRRWWQRASKADFTAAATALHRVGLYDLRDRVVGELSGGQRQRVLMARALAVEPAVLLLDEPMTGLDIPAQDALHALFAQLTSEGEALLMTTHDIASALTLCDRLYLLRGTVMGSGPPDQLRSPEVWRRTFEVGPSSSLLTVVEACLGAAPTGEIVCEENVGPTLPTTSSALGKGQS